MDNVTFPRRLWRKRRGLSILAAGLVGLILTGCGATERAEAIVLEKEAIAAAAEKSDAPSPSPTGTVTTVPEGESLREMKEGEIEVDGYVMEPAVRGTARDPRALSGPQWLVKVRLVADGRMFNVPATEAQFEKVKPGDRIWISYRRGKYSGTVWAASIEEK